MKTSGVSNDYIRNCDSTDELHIFGGSHTTMTSGDDAIVRVGSGKITLEGGSHYLINSKNNSTINSGISDSIDSSDSTNNTLSTALIVTNSDPLKVNANSSIKTIDASSRNKLTYIVGNSLANTILVAKKEILFMLALVMTQSSAMSATIDSSVRRAMTH